MTKLPKGVITSAALDELVTKGRTTPIVDQGVLSHITEERVKVLVTPDMADTEARLSAALTEGGVEVLAETVEDEGCHEAPIDHVFELHADPFRAGRRFGNGARLAAAMAMLGTLPSGGYSAEPTAHDRITAKVHDNQGALDRAKAKRERKLQRNARINNG
jgi:hypothetical protein